MDSQEQSATTRAPKNSQQQRWQTLAAWVSVALAAITALTGGGFWLYQQRDTSPGVEIIVPTPAPVVVQVSGAVVNPGVYELPDGSRVQALIDAAGGSLSDANLENLNLAKSLVDGERIDVPLTGTSELASTDTGSSRSGVALLDLNTATQSELEGLPNIGPARANLIITYRHESGPIRTVDDLLAISGIGPATVEAIRDLVVQP